MNDTPSNGIHVGNVQRSSRWKFHIGNFPIAKLLKGVHNFHVYQVYNIVIVNCITILYENSFQTGVLKDFILECLRRFIAPCQSISYSFRTNDGAMEGYILFLHYGFLCRSCKYYRVNTSIRIFYEDDSESDESTKKSRGMWNKVKKTLLGSS